MDRREEGIGRAILERSPTGVAPTAMSKLLYAHARLIRDELNLAGQRLAATDRGDGDAIASGTLPSLAPSIVPAVGRWRATYPARLRLRVALSMSRMRYAD